jgi:hypothetical protein
MKTSQSQNIDGGALKKGIISWAIKGVLYKTYAAVVLMISAGRWNWRAGWIITGYHLRWAWSPVVVPSWQLVPFYSPLAFPSCGR